MKFFLRYALFWSGLFMTTFLLYWVFKRFFGLPAGVVLVVAPILVWSVPRPWRFVLPIAVVAELLAITPPLALTVALFSPLLIWWLRGRTEVDISFSYAILIAASVALELAILIGASTYPWWSHIPWLSVALAWLCSTVTVLVGTIIVPSIHSRLLHGRFY